MSSDPCATDLQGRVTQARWDHRNKVQRIFLVAGESPALLHACSAES